MRQRLEENSQIKFFRELKKNYPIIRACTFAIPNGGYRSLTEAKRLKASGVTAGIPDIFSAFAAKGFHGLFIEMKKPKIKGQSKAITSAEQKEKIALLNEQGFKAEVCYGFDEAYNCILEYWNIGPW